MSFLCRLCNSVSVSIEDRDSLLCDYCFPDSCVKCSVKSVTFTENKFKCSHGCSYDLQEYISQKLYTVILNGDWKDKLSLAGRRVEYIIPNTQKIKIHNSLPSSIHDTCVLGLHYTENDQLKKEQEYDSERYTGNERFNGTIREKAAYAWPYKRSYADEHLSFENRTPVFFEVPKNEVYVSSYRFLELVSDEDYEYTVPISKYEPELTFTPDKLYQLCKERNRPADRNELLRM